MHLYLVINKDTQYNYYYLLPNVLMNSTYK